MTPLFFDHTNTSTLCELIDSNRQLANARMKEHWKYFITESDFKEIQDNGLNSVRISLGYWNVRFATG